MKKLLLFLTTATLLWCCGHSLPDSKKAYVITTNFVKKAYDNQYPEIDCPFADYQTDYLNDSSYIVMSHFTYAGFNPQRFYYKARVKWRGGKWSDVNNWTLVYIEQRKP